MEVTTPTGVAQDAIAPEPGSADAFQSLWDSGLDKDQGESPPQDAVEADEPPAEQEAAAEPEPVTEAPAEPETAEAAKAYDSLDAYLKESGVEPEGFMSLPVAVKVDGKDQSIPLAEVIKGYQLSSAGYQRLTEAAQAREAFAKEQSEVRQALGTRIQQAENVVNLAQQQLTQEFQSINWQELNAQDPVEYTRQMNAFQLRAVQIDQVMKNVATAQQEQARAQEQARLQALPQERERLLTAIPEWKDAAKMQEGQRRIIDAAKKAGFTDAELNGIYDHRYLVMLDKAARYDALQAQTPAKLKQVRAAPQMAKPGTRTTRDPNSVSIQNAKDAWQRSGFRDDDAAAALFERLG